MKTQYKNIIGGIAIIIILLAIVLLLDTLTLINKSSTTSYRSDLTAQAISTSGWQPIIGYWLEGLKGTPVTTIELLLVERGYDPGPVDGYFDSETKAAVIQFTNDEGLYVRPSRQGIVRGTVRTKMNEYITQFMHGKDISKPKIEEQLN